MGRWIRWNVGAIALFLGSCSLEDPREICNDPATADEDGDGLFNCLDVADCQFHPACAGVTNTGGEGTAAGDCRDGADNDADGLFDCDDPGCAGSPDCDGGDAGDAGDAGDGGDAGATSGYGAYLTQVVGYQVVQFDLREGNGATLCDTSAPIVFLNECFCTAAWKLEGTVLVESEGERNTYDGTWDLLWENCDPPAVGGNEDFHESSVWWDKVNPETYHTIRFEWDDRNQELAALREWVAHKNILQNTPSQNPFRDKQYWVQFSEAHEFDLDKNYVDYFEVQRIPQGPGVTLKVTTTVDMQFATGTDTPTIRFPDPPWAGDTADTGSP